MTFTEVGADGLVVRTPIRKQAIGWNELDFVRWQRESSHDVLVFCAIDGREVKAAGVAVAVAGQGERRMLRLRGAVQMAWAAGSAPRQRRRLVIRLAEALRARRAQMAPTECEVPGSPSGLAMDHL
ncbi:acyl-CoA reductase-like NAD-dependent aldehyde dehydrogenase [Hamadaea flava]|uniref:Uncharacterized protein n=1 Tax=Hamadaea flava TaxID=1742688 RepID=A0ABV8LW19_9ACTN|nr:hypothetical protein [Hamadaea flava]MCP2327526.1 acyl-CoA reductase-like NAD-dependent aldehyde dehydrogenase [Hamadaea flava]